MRRAFSLAVVMLLPAAALAVMALLIYQPGLSDEARQALDRYLQARGLSAAALGPIRRAERPGGLTASMSLATYGSSYYFAVSHNDQPPATAVNSIWDRPPLTDSLTLAPAMANSGGQKPLPYPPHDLWCVRLSGEKGAAPASVFVALHGDLYVDTWVVHELSADPAALAADWNAVGCPVDWQP